MRVRRRLDTEMVVADRPDRVARRMVAAHAMYPNARRCRRLAQEDVADRRSVRSEARDRPSVKLGEVSGTTCDVAADKVGVAALQIRGRHDTRFLDAVAKPRSVSLDLSLDPFAHVDRRAVRHVAIRPKRMLAWRRTARIEHAWLRHEHVRPLAVTAFPRRALRRRDLRERPAKV